MEYEYNDKSLSKHKVSRADANEVLSINNPTRRDFDLPLTATDNLRIMFVGYNQAGRLLEMGVEFIDEDKAYVFHGQTVSPRCRKLYEEKIANE